ncbi:sensor histidine kinase [cf. Phormidesmis sp. LEGE 11477]|uniref:sensor histidine kinase n=1 Tax=cf. Phormidesmis sp. LEGE 11477 TaxID=1828680 RepID=UPI0018811071|nr:response regulator [cf. Phormidesmis sp. LEGE 11477]MBE9062262.1 hybrid sensor histidine kinase/response regulator [cf. Phormidesmis sp. LEGE 11477]
MKDIEILVVDDTVANLEVMDEVLSSAQYYVSAVTSGQRALKQLQEQTPALILLDVQMPGMDGFETCRQIKANPATAPIPIIFITALSDAESIAKGFSLGAVDYITKPFRETELLARVRTHISLCLLTEKLEEEVAGRTAELETTVEQLQQSQLQIVQSEKMATLGNLVAGVAHEINNPTGFLHGSITNGKTYTEDLLTHIALYQQHCLDPHPDIQEHAEEIDLDFISEDMPKLLNSMQEATNRIKDISNSLRTFSRTDIDRKTSANLNEGLDSTLMILKYRLKADEYRPSINVIKDYGDLPLIDCFPGQLNQVFINVLANAVDMFDDAAQKTTFKALEQNSQEITIQTAISEAENSVEICIRDNGTGMPEPVAARIFDRLFTTKGVGKGTGLGLAIAHQIVTEKHGGKLMVKSAPGQGTTFVIQLPL